MVTLHRLALAVFVVLLPSHPPSNPPYTPPRLPPLPHFIPSALGPVEVHIVPHLTCNGTPALGCYDSDQRYLSIRDSIPLTTAWQTLRHERQHMIFRDANVGFASENAEDRLADIEANADVLEMLARP